MSTESLTPNKKIFRLSDRIVGTSDLRRVIRELEIIDDSFYQADLRSPGAKFAQPKTSRLIANLFEVNDANIVEQTDRKNILTKLKRLDTIAPVMHLSFATEAKTAFAEQVVAWTRKNINPFVLINFGLQPSIIVGCNVRTTNKVFDMSLRHRLDESKHILNEKIKKMAETNG